MPIHFCPNCNQRYMVGFDTCDFSHICNSGNLALDQEDVVIVGNWEDFEGTGTRPPQEVLMAGAANKLWGRRTEIQFGADKEDLTRRGNISATHRQRQFLQFINLREKE